jgi:hypothetical protein
MRGCPLLWAGVNVCWNRERRPRGWGSSVLWVEGGVEFFEKGGATLSGGGTASVLVGGDVAGLVAVPVMVYSESGWLDSSWWIGVYD